jgi:predicted HicB family RNase H-like nuclease
LNTVPAARDGVSLNEWVAKALEKAVPAQNA